MKELSIDNRIKFKMVELNKWDIYKVNWKNEIITVISWKIYEKIKWELKTFESSVYHSWSFEALEETLITVFEIENHDIILDKFNVDSEFWEYCRSNWKQLRELYDVEWFEKVDLYRWDQVEHKFDWENYKFNLRFCWANIDCLWHNEHNFIEVHTNVAWIWNMQKSLDWTDEWLVETVSLWIWATHRKFNIESEIEENGNPKYPFHRWLWGSRGNIWMAVEKY